MSCRMQPDARPKSLVECRRTPESTQFLHTASEADLETLEKTVGPARSGARRAARCHSCNRPAEGTGVVVANLRGRHNQAADRSAAAARSFLARSVRQSRHDAARPG